MKEGFGQTRSENSPDVTLFQAQQSKALPKQSRATVFRLLSKMVREKLRILLSSKIQAVNLRVLFRTDGVGQPSCSLQMWPTLKSSPGLHDQCLRGIWKSMREFSGTSLWSWSANTRNNFTHEPPTVPGWHRQQEVTAEHWGRTELLLALPWVSKGSCGSFT